MKLKNLNYRILHIISTGLILVFVEAIHGQAVNPPARETIDTARNVIEQWVDTQRALSKEKQNWEMAQQSLNDRIEMVKKEIDSLREKISKSTQDISDADKNQAKLVEERETLKNAAETFKGIVDRLESKTIALNRQLPDPIRERVKPLNQRITEDPNQTKLSLSQRFQNIIGILNEVNKFNNEITVTSEVRTLHDGSTAEVTTVYIGLGQAYYVNADRTIAGAGRQSENGWNWEPANEAAGNIADVINILKNEKVADFIPLPVKIK
ncbi:MAG: DUF3450 family protein [Sedimentisphaerales bacterium]|nr:DUF3450 family protein [Sedimentisphaerales bacterium]